MISNKELLEFLDDDTLDCSSETTLKRILEEELEKSEEEIDTDLVEYCLDALEKLEEQEKNSDNGEKDADLKSKKGTHHFKKILIIAAVLSVLVVGMFSVSAAFSEVSLLDGIVEFYNEHIRVRYDKESDKANKYNLLGSELAKELESNGIAPVMLPEALLTDEYCLTGITYDTFDTFSTARIEFNNDNLKIKGYVVIDQYVDAQFLPATDFQGVDDLIKITVSDIDVLIFTQKQSASISYQDGSIQYDIVLSDNVSIDKAVEFAKTIK